MSFPRYPAYKDSGIPWLGEVPEHWEVERIKFLFQERDERSISGGEILMGLSKERGVLPRSEMTQGAAEAETREGYKMCNSGNLIMNKMQAWNGVFGVSPDDGIVSPDYAVYVAQTGVNVHFFNHVFRTPLYAGTFSTRCRGMGSAFLRLNTSDFGDVPVAVPPAPEQSAIAAFLDRETRKIDALVAEQEKLIGLLKEKRQAVISHAVTKGLDPSAPMKDSGIPWLGKVPVHWAVCALNYRYEIALGKMLDEKRFTGKHSAPYLRNTDVQWGRINVVDLPEMDFADDELARYGLSVGDLLVCEGGEVGRAAIWSGDLEPCFYQKALHRIRPRCPERDSTQFLFFVFYAFATLGLFAGSEGKATISHLTAETLRRYRFTFPPLPEQSAIAAFLDEQTAKFDTLAAEAQRAIALLKEHRSALISAAVTGKIDVRDCVALREVA